MLLVNFLNRGEYKRPLLVKIVGSFFLLILTLIDLGILSDVSRDFEFYLIWEVPMLILLFFYYEILICSNSPASCENSLLLPILKKLGVLKKYSPIDRSQLISIISPIVISVYLAPILVSFFSLLLYDDFEEFFYLSLYFIMILPISFLVIAILRIIKFDWSRAH